MINLCIECSQGRHLSLEKCTCQCSQCGVELCQNPDRIGIDPYHGLDDDALLALYDRQRQRVKESRDVLGHLEQEIFRRTEERGATGIPSDRYECSIKASNSYDQTKLIPLKEVLSPDELDRCCTPEHQETVTVPEKWNVTKLWPIARKHGVDVVNAIEKARIPGRRTLDFKRKEPK